MSTSSIIDLMLALILLFLSSVCSAYEDPPPNVGFGLTYLSDNTNNNYYTLNIGDINHFTQKPDDIYGITKYGYGKGEMELGRSIGVNLTAISGISLYGLNADESGLSPQFGMEMGGRIIVNSKAGINNYYEWFPGFSFGPQYDIGWARMLLIGRSGVATGNYDSNSILPNLRLFYGEGFYFDTKAIQIGADNINFGYNRLYSVDVQDKIESTVIGIRIEKLNSVSQYLDENRMSILIKHNW